MKVEFKFVPTSGSVLVYDVFLQNEDKDYDPETGELKEQKLADHEKLCLVKIDHNIVRALGKMAGKTIEEAFLFVEELANKRLKDHELQNAEAFKNAFLILNSVKKSQPVQNISATNDFLIIPASFEAYSKAPNELTDKDLKLVKMTDYSNYFLYKELNGKSIGKIAEVLSLELSKYSPSKLKGDDGHLLEELRAIQLLGQIFGLPNKKFWE